MMSVCAVQIIQPKAMLGVSGILKSENAAPMAKGYTKMPPLVAAMVKLAEIKAIKMAANGRLLISGTANVVT